MAMDASFGALLHRHGSGDRADDEAIRYGDDAVTWRALDARSDARAAQLIAAGVERDDMVAIALPNGVAHHEWAFAAWKAGATPCILPAKLPGTELRDIIGLAAPRVLVRAGGEAVGEAAGGVIEIAAESRAPVDFDRPPRDLVAGNWKAVASGGSTGRPKLIVDHGPPCYTAKIDGLIRMVGLPAGGVMLNPGPLYHNAPFLFSSLGLLSGTRIVGLARFDPKQCLQLIERERVEWAFMVPTMMHRIWSLGADVRARYDLSSLKVVVHMAAACPIWLKQAWIEWLGPERVLEGYAGTESPGTMITGAEWLQRPGSVGRVPPRTMTVRDADGRECAAGEIGEIFFPPGSAERFHYVGAQPKLDPEGRMSLGDMGHVDADGYLFLADRRSDLILRGGANVYPAEVEAALSEHPGIAEAVVIGLPCDDLGQRIHALIEGVNGLTPDLTAVDTFLRSRLSGYKCPDSYEIASENLRDDAGKVRRAALRDERAGWLRDGRDFRQRVVRIAGATGKSIV